MESIYNFADAHQELFAAVVWPLVTAFFLWLLKPRTDEDFARLPPRIAGILRLISALGLDPVKATKAVKQVVTGKGKDDDRWPPLPPLGPLSVIVLSIAFASSACNERPACRPEQLAQIEASYISEALATCRGRMVSECVELEGIRAKYRALREEWVSCR